MLVSENNHFFTEWRKLLLVIVIKAISLQHPYYISSLSHCLVYRLFTGRRGKRLKLYLAPKKDYCHPIILLS